jgi:hypothetical protein
MLRLRRLHGHLATASREQQPQEAAVAGGRWIRFPHCGEVRAVRSPPRAVLDAGLGPGHRAELVASEDPRLSGAYVLRGLSIDERAELPGFPPAQGPLPLGGPLQLRAPSATETAAELARRLEDDGLLYLPGALSPEQVASLRAAIGRTATDPRNPVDSGRGTPAAVEALAAAQANGTEPGWGHAGNKGIMSWWNRFETGEMLQYLDLDPTCAVAEATLGEDCHLIQQKGWSTGPGRSGDSNLHLDFLPMYCAGAEQALRDGRLRIPVYLITAHYYLDDMTEDAGMALGPTVFVPGSHLSGRSPLPGEHSWRGIRPQAAQVRAGDCVMFRSDVWVS